MNVKDKWVVSRYDYCGQVNIATGKEHGAGRRCWHDGAIEVGQFENGQLHGFGREILADGSYYEGSWNEGGKHGEGK